MNKKFLMPKNHKTQSNTNKSKISISIKNPKNPRNAEKSRLEGALSTKRVEKACARSIIFLLQQEQEDNKRRASVLQKIAFAWTDANFLVCGGDVDFWLCEVTKCWGVIMSDQMGSFLGFELNRKNVKDCSILQCWKQGFEFFGLSKKCLILQCW